MKLRSIYLITLASLVLVAFAVRAISIDVQSLWRDEVDAMLFATAPLDEVLFHFTQPRWNGPLYFLLLRGWILLSGTSEYAMRFFSLFFGVLCVPLMYVLGRRLFNRQTGVIAALLMAVSPYFTWYSQEVKMYTLVPALALLAIYALRRALSEPQGRALSQSKGRAGWYWWVVQVAATSLAFYAHILAAMLIPVQVLLYFTWWPQARRRWFGALVALACLTLPYLPLAAWEVPLLLDERVTSFSHQPLGEMVETLLASWRAGNLFLLRARETGFGHFGLPEIVGMLLNGWSMGYFGTFGQGWPYGTILMVVMAAWGMVEPSSLILRKSDRKRIKALLAMTGGVLFRLGRFVLPLFAYLIFFLRGSKWSGIRERLSLLCWVAAPPLALWYVSQWQPLFTDRYLIWAGLAFYLLIARGLAAIWRTRNWGRWAAVVLISLVLGFNVTNLWQQATQQGKANFRAAAAYVAANYEVDLDKGDLPGSHQAACEDCAFRVYIPVALSRYSEFEGLIIFQIPHGRYTFDYYFPYEGYPWADGLYTNHRHPDGAFMMSEEEAAEKMERMTEGYDVVWLVASETEMWDERGLVKGWLDANLRLTAETGDEENQYLWVDVYRYER
ncbi:MAG: glycosyltransferase family 39 protein [Anaerolineae bacterium]|jgi:4-amino-4-deoxy-L-arabinose transferase-like glycosyltransferase